ncbi:MAG: polysaccharide biosynthesis/export family protein [Chitinophagaceae bacterium]
MRALQLKEPVIQINDLLGIQVFSNSLNQEQANMFSSTGANQGYLVGITGNIDMPIVGKIKTAGLTKVQLQALLIEKISPYVKDPSVLIRFLEFKINVLGEVKSPGSHKFETDRVTIIDALSAAGDLTDFGKRQDVLVIREESTDRKYYHVDLRSGALFQSPVYQLQPNDIVYVGANINKIKTINTNSNSQQALQLFLTAVSVISTIIFLITNIK